MSAFESQIRVNCGSPTLTSTPLTFSPPDPNFASPKPSPAPAPGFLTLPVIPAVGFGLEFDRLDPLQRRRLGRELHRVGQRHRRVQAPQRCQARVRPEVRAGQAGVERLHLAPRGGEEPEAQDQEQQPVDQERPGPTVEFPGGPGVDGLVPSATSTAGILPPGRAGPRGRSSRRVRGWHRHRDPSEKSSRAGPARASL